MIFGYFLLAVVGYAVYYHTNGDGKVTERVRQFKDKFFPVEADISDHILRNVPFGFVVGRNVGKVDYNNPMPLIVQNEFVSSLNETQYGYAAPLSSPAINTQNYQRLINDQFNIQEHSRLDITRMDPSKGRVRRAQYAFIDRTE